MSSFYVHVYSLMAEVFKIGNDSNRMCLSRVSTDAESNQCFILLALLPRHVTHMAILFHLEALFLLGLLKHTLLTFLQLKSFQFCYSSKTSIDCNRDFVASVAVYMSVPRSVYTSGQTPLNWSLHPVSVPVFLLDISA